MIEQIVGPQLLTPLAQRITDYVFMDSLKVLVKEKKLFLETMQKNSVAIMDLI